MKYYLAIVQNDSSAAIYSYTNLDEALAAFHSELAYYAEGRDKTLCIIFDSDGGRIRTETWTRVPEPTPEPDPGPESSEVE